MEVSLSDQLSLC